MPRTIVEFLSTEIDDAVDTDLTNYKKAALGNFVDWPADAMVDMMALTGSAAEGDWEVEVLVNGIAVVRLKNTITGRPILYPDHWTPVAFSKPAGAKFAIINKDAGGTNSGFMAIIWR